MSDFFATLSEHDRRHRQAVAEWERLQAGLPGTLDPGVGGLTICSVAYGARTLLDLNHHLMRRLNPTARRPEWLLFDNNVEAGETIGHDPRFTVVRPAARQLDMGYEHALGISALLARVRTRFVLILDPDCFVVRPDWIDGVLEHMTERQLGFFGTPINPRRANSYRYFPYMVCLFIDLSRVPVNTLCFLPDVWNYSTNVTYRVRKALAGIPKAGVLFRWLLTEQWRTNGWRIKAQYGDGRRAAFECVQPVWDVDEAIPAGSFKRLLHHLTPGAVSPVPKRADYCTPRGFASMGAPDVAGLGWEEFVWRDEPFAFHIGSAHSRSRADYLGRLERVLDEIGGREDAAVPVGSSAALERQGHLG